MRPFSTTTVWSRSTRGASMGTTEACTKASGRDSGAEAATAMRADAASSRAPASGSGRARVIGPSVSLLLYLYAPRGPGFRGPGA